MSGNSVLIATFKSTSVILVIHAKHALRLIIAWCDFNLRTPIQIAMTTHFINNQRIEGSSGESIPVLDPSDGQVLAHLARGNAAMRKKFAAL